MNQGVACLILGSAVVFFSLKVELFHDMYGLGVIYDLGLSCHLSCECVLCCLSVEVLNSADRRFTTICDNPLSS